VYPNKTVAVVDHGLFVDFAARLQKSFGRVLYTTPWQCALPKSNDCIVGTGLVERIESIWDHIDEIDLFIFPDIYHGPTQRYLESLGKRVWGSREGENLEIWRLEAKRYMSKQGIAIGPYATVEGTDRLRKSLRETTDKFVKISKTRGDAETFKHNTWSLTEPWLNELEHKLGPKKDLMEFILEDDISPAVEVGFDGYSVDGEFSSPGIVGVEIKDDGYLGKVSDPLPAQLSDINRKLSATFKEVNYRNFFCSEVRIKEDKGYMLDPCTRMPLPPGELYISWIKNLPEVIWEGSNGKYVAPQYSETWGASLILVSEWANDKWMSIEVPKEFRDNVTLRGHVRVGGKDYVVPGHGVGACHALGATADEAMSKVKDIVGELKGLTLDYHIDALDKAKEEFGKIKFDSPKEAKPEISGVSGLASLLQPQSLEEELTI